MLFEKENPEMLVLLQTFEQFGVRYLIAGGFAVNRYGFNRTTGDLDIYLEDSEQNRQNLIQALDQMGYGKHDILLTAPITTGYCEVLMGDGFFIDLMTDLPGLDQTRFARYFESATVDQIRGIPVQFLNYDHLIENKKATNRNKDQIDVLELERINRKH